eukprot:403334371
MITGAELKEIKENRAVQQLKPQINFIPIHSNSENRDSRPGTQTKQNTQSNQSLKLQKLQIELIQQQHYQQQFNQNNQQSRASPVNSSNTVNNNQQSNTAQTQMHSLKQTLPKIVINKSRNIEGVKNSQSYINNKDPQLLIRNIKTDSSQEFLKYNISEIKNNLSSFKSNKLMKDESGEIGGPNLIHYPTTTSAILQHQISSINTDKGGSLSKLLSMKQSSGFQSHSPNVLQQKLLNKLQSINSKNGNKVTLQINSNLNYQNETDQVNNSKLSLTPNQPGKHQHNPLPNFHTSKTSSKTYGSVFGFAANTNVGTVRQHNEDRIAIILNMLKPKPQSQSNINKIGQLNSDIQEVQNQYQSDGQNANQISEKNFPWPQIQIFGIYDGHGGVTCADYLKENLHNRIVKNPNFPSNIELAIQEGAKQCDQEFLNKVYQEYMLAAQASQIPHEHTQVNRAGSCAIVIMNIGKDVYIVNRVNKNGGKIYQSSTIFFNGHPTPQIKQSIISKISQLSEPDKDNPFVGPYRVFPGKLSVTRTFGDIEAKLPEFNGRDGVVVCEPEINIIKNGGEDIDFIVIGSDGIFDRLDNEQISVMAWDVIRKYEKNEKIGIHSICGKIADEIIIQSAVQKSIDNLSVVVVGFEKLNQYLIDKRSSNNSQVVTAIDYDKSLAKKRKSNQQPPNLQNIKLKNGLNINSQKIYLKLQQRNNQSRNINGVLNSNSSGIGNSIQGSDEIENQKVQAYKQLNKYKNQHIVTHSQTIIEQNESQPANNRLILPDMTQQNSSFINKAQNQLQPQITQTTNNRDMSTTLKTSFNLNSYYTPTNESRGQAMKLLSVKNGNQNNEYSQQKTNSTMYSGNNNNHNNHQDIQRLKIPNKIPKPTSQHSSQNQNLSPQHESSKLL